MKLEQKINVFIVVFLSYALGASAARSCGVMDFDWTNPDVSATIADDCVDLNLYNARIGDDGAKALGLALMSTAAEIESLNLRDNRIGDEGIAAIANALSQNKHLKFLQLRGNDIGDVGAVAIANALHTNTVLTDLFLTWLDIGDNGAIAIGDALKNNPESALRVLHLSWNHIGSDGAIALSSALSSPDLVLQELNLQNNRKIDNRAALSFMRAIETNHHLTKLWLTGTQVDATYTSHFNSLLSRGPDSRMKLAEVAVVLEECGLIGTLDIVHGELGVDEVMDLAHVSRNDLKDSKTLKPVRRNKLIKCLCDLKIEGNFLEMEDQTMCPGREL